MTFSGSSFYMAWIFLSLIFFFFAYSTHTHLFSKLPAIIKYLFIFFVVIGLLLFIFIEALIIKEFDDKTNDEMDYLIVLGAQVKSDGPSIILKYRLDAAIDYLNDHPDTLCVVTGAKGSNEPFTEAEGMKEYLVQKGISIERIILEDKSTNTFENIRNSSQLIDKEKNVAIVTNNFHLFRAKAIAKKAGYKNIYGIAAYSKPLYLPNNMFRECIGVLKDFLVGNL